MNPHPLAPWTGSPALVVLLAEPSHPLWDARASALTGRLEGALPGTFVTSAFLYGGGPSLRDALAAARFMGCRAAVVAWVDDAEHTWGAVVEPLVSEPGIQVTIVRCDDTARSVESAYRHTLDRRAARADSA